LGQPPERSHSRSVERPYCLGPKMTLRRCVNASNRSGVRRSELTSDLVAIEKRPERSYFRSVERPILLASVQPSGLPTIRSSNRAAASDLAAYRPSSGSVDYPASDLPNSRAASDLATVLCCKMPDRSYSRSVERPTLLASVQGDTSMFSTVRTYDLPDARVARGRSARTLAVSSGRPIGQTASLWTIPAMRLCFRSLEPGLPNYRPGAGRSGRRAVARSPNRWTIQPGVHVFDRSSAPTFRVISAEGRDHSYNSRATPPVASTARTFGPMCIQPYGRSMGQSVVEFLGR